MTLLKKLVAMAILGAIGATMGAGMGEMLFQGETPPPTSSRRRQLHGWANSRPLRSTMVKPVPPHFSQLVTRPSSPSSDIP